MNGFVAAKILCISWVAFLALSWAETPPPSREGFDAVTRDRLRSRLELLHNELDLMVRNQKAEESDLRRQEREIQLFRLYSRIPFAKDLAGIQHSLKESAKKNGLDFVSFQETKISTQAFQSFPKRIYTDEKQARPRPEQIAETLPFTFSLKGKRERVLSWIGKWKETHTRLLELDGSEAESVIALDSGKKWKIKARAYRYRDIGNLRLVPRNPMELLPDWAKKNPRSFSEAEPRLWSYIEKINQLIPNSKSHYERRSKFFINDARMSFYLARTR